jgi:recombination protein RecT
MSQLTTTEKKALSISERFTNSVLSKFSSQNGTANITPFQKRLIQSYFSKIDQVLKASEIKRLQKDEKYRDSLAYDWNNVNLDK